MRSAKLVKFRFFKEDEAVETLKIIIRESEYNRAVAILMEDNSINLRPFETMEDMCRYVHLVLDTASLDMDPYKYCQVEFNSLPTMFLNVNQLGNKRTRHVLINALRDQFKGYLA